MHIATQNSLEVHNSMEVKDVFGAQPESVFKFLCQNGQGLYIPAYQRDYSWDVSKITRLIDDISHGYSQLLEHEDSITFIGTIISIVDTKHTTVEPAVVGKVPSKVMTIIDGQQRLTTLLLIITVLHNLLSSRLEKIKDEAPWAAWIKGQCPSTIGRLALTFEEDRYSGEGSFKYYPRMIRAYVDSWSTESKTAKYDSPIAHYLFSYGEHARANPGQLFSFKLSNDQSEKKYGFMQRSVKEIKKLIDQIAESDGSTKESAIEIPSLAQILDSDRLQETLLQARIPDSIRSDISNKENKTLREMVRLLLFTNFVLDRIAITIVTAKNEDYAFDMFESLNTTGEPLTAYETFKPRVIADESLSSYKHSPSYNYITNIDDYLDDFARSDDKQIATSDLIITFASSESGQKLSKRLSDQRRYLSKYYNQLPNIDEKRRFTEHLCNTAQFLENVWPKVKIPSKLVIDEIPQKDQVLLCVEFLRSLNHSVAMAPLQRYYTAAKHADASCRQISIEEFSKIALAFTAFSVLWRSSRIGTGGIDSYYRRLMEIGDPITGLTPIARRTSESTNTLPAASSVKAALRRILLDDGNIKGKTDWVKTASKLALYKIQKDVTRFILLAAAHDSVPDSKNPGLTEQGRVGILPLMSAKYWRDDSAQTVEHIAPQQNSGGWQGKIYDDPSTIDRIGNLTLLPIEENSSIGNSSWQKKQLIYKILAASTIAELEPLRAHAKDHGIDISTAQDKLLTNSSYLPLAKAISLLEGEWSYEIIEERGQRICELAWDRLWPWLSE